MISLKNDRILRAIRHEPLDRTPVWLMRQAGRYLPEYRALRQKAGSFLTLCKTPELATEVTLQPLVRFPLDAAILFSDILTIPDALGLGLYFVEGEGPRFMKPLRNEKEIDTLPTLNPEESLGYVFDAIRMTQHELSGKVPLIGFCGSPWTIAAYMVEGNANKAFPAIRALIKESPLILHRLLDKLADAVQAHLNAQIRAGVQVVMIFDTWGGMLNTLEYQIFDLPYVKKVIEGLTPENIPVILFTKGGGQWLHLMMDSGCDVMGVDWLTNLTAARLETKGRVALQGNMNPTILYQSEDIIRKEVSRILESYGTGSGHIFNLGHGIPQDVLPDHVEALVLAVQSLSISHHQHA